YYTGGFEHVAAYLTELDLSAFDPKAPPPKTAAFWDIVDANRAPEDAELADVLDALGNPDAVTPNQLRAKATGNTGAWLADRWNRRAIPHPMQRRGYTPLRNHDPKHGHCKIGATRQPAYAKSKLPKRARR